MPVAAGSGAQADARLLAAARRALDIGLAACADRARQGGGAQFEPAQFEPVLGLAVSGGGDSVAMLHLLAAASPQARSHLRVVTIDHDLREGSAEEAEFVADLCARLEIPHDILRWRHGEIIGNLQDQARRARYGLIRDWARQHALSAVAVAHTADDQAETFLMALARRSGLDGLAAMRPQWSEGGIRMFRPFLEITRVELRDYLRRHALAWRDDPSNENPRFQRVRARRAIAALGPVGITAHGLSETIHHLNAALGLIEAETLRAFQRLGRESAGSLILDRNGFSALEPEIARRLLLAALGWMTAGGGVAADLPDRPVPVAPRALSVTRLQNAIAMGRDATLAGCRIRLERDAIRLLREPRALSGLVCGPDGLWDGKWRLVPLAGSDAALPEGAVIAALGEAGLRLCPGWRDSGLRRDQLLVTPALWCDGHLIAAPLAGKPAGWQAKIDFDPASFILSH